jgi:hypothetical protein
LLALTAHGTIDGRSDGSLRYGVELTAQRDFSYSRIGLCILHPCELCAGRRYVTRTPTGVFSGRFPRHVGVQPVRDGVIYPLLDSFTELEIDMDGVAVSFAFEGDLFESEDQRNWTDASFKTYSTPLALGLPHQARAGEVIAQRVTVACAGTPPRRTRRSSETEVEIGPPVGRELPPIGLGMASHGLPLDAAQRELLLALRLDHLRVDVHLNADDWQQTLLAGTDAAAAVGAGTELAVFVDAPNRRRLQTLSGSLADLGPERIHRVLVFHEGTETTPAPWVPEVRRALGAALPGTPFSGGTNLSFAEVNRFRPEVETIDGIAWSITPTAHATDDRSMIETLAPQADQVASARAFGEGPALFIGPVTLRMRWNAHARLVADDPPGPGELPFPVDARQAAPFAAAWTLGSIARLARAGADSLTYFETTGWRGLIETDEVRPPAFQSTPGQTFPVYDVFAALAGWRATELLAVTTGDRLRSDALALRRGSAIRVLIGNMTGAVERIRLTGLGAQRASVQAPSWSEQRTAVQAEGAVTLALGPYGIAIIDSVVS